MIEDFLVFHFFFFNDTATTEIYTLSLHDALPIHDLPPKAYHLADFNAYERTCGRRWAMYISSLACPYNCGYCTNAGVYGRQWNALEPDQVVEETTDLVKGYRWQLLWIVDDNLLVDRERALGMAEGL